MLFRLKERFPDFRVSLFTVPVDKKEDWGSYLIREDNLNMIKRNLSWMQLIPHGLNHDGSEVREWSYQHFKSSVMLDIDAGFLKDGLPYEKGFCAPHWRWNEDVVRALDDTCWWGAVDPRQPDMPCPLKFYRYSHPIDAFPTDLPELKLHGHVYGTKNDLGKCLDNLLALPEDVGWRFVTDFLETK